MLKDNQYLIFFVIINVRIIYIYFKSGAVFTYFDLKLALLVTNCHEQHGSELTTNKGALTIMSASIHIARNEL